MFVDMNTFRKTNRKTFVHQVERGFCEVGELRKSLPVLLVPVSSISYVETGTAQSAMLLCCDVEKGRGRKSKLKKLLVGRLCARLAKRMSLRCATGHVSTSAPTE